MRTKLEQTQKYFTLGMAIIVTAAIVYIAYGYYATSSLVGEKVIIDGKELTITAWQGYEVILSDRTRITTSYARTIIKGKR